MPPDSGTMKRIAELTNTGDTTEAIKEIDLQFRAGSETAELRYAYGLSHVKQGKYPQAEAAFKRALELDPDFYQAWSDLGLVYDETDRLEAAIDAYTKALDGNQKYFAALKNRGNTHRRMRNFPASASDYIRALDQEPDDYCVKGFLSYVAETGSKEAIAPTVWESAEFRRDYYSCRGIALAMDGHCPEAIAAYTNAITMAIADSETYNNRGFCYAKLGQLLKAQDDFAQATRLDPNNFQAHNNLKQAEALLQK